MLSKTGIVAEKTANAVIDELNKIKRQLETGEFDKNNHLYANETDIHRALERRLEEIIGEAAGVLNLAKSRNDQIATDVRLWLREAIVNIHNQLLELRKILLGLAERDLQSVMPGYTHMQPAMPILLSHWWLANEARLKRDSTRLKELFKRVNLLPLGVGALAGVSQPIDRLYVAELLGFDGVIENSLDAISDRDYLIEFGAFACILGTHLSQLGSELLLWATQEFGFVRLPKAFDFGSASMPQKRNPELLEILRSKPAALIGFLTGVLAQLKGLPISYSQDLQECFPNLLQMDQNVQFTLDLTIVLLPSLQFDPTRMQDLANVDLTNATNALDYLLEQGIPMDKATKVCEALVIYCKERHKQLSDLELNEWMQFSPAFDEQIHKYVAIVESVDSRSSLGGTAQAQVVQALKRASELWNDDMKNFPSLPKETLRHSGKASKNNSMA
jgi:argininosuccinate lyase